MNEDIREQLENMFHQTISGFFGEEAKKEAIYFKNLPLGFEVFYKVIQDFYLPLTQQIGEEDRIIFQNVDIITQLLIVVYRETKTKNQDFAKAYMKSFIEDFPETQGTALASKWQNLASASISFRSLIFNKNEALTLWNSSKTLFESYNEFLNALLGYLIIGWQITKGDSYSINIFNNAYGNKAKAFSEITNGDNGAFYLIHRIARPAIRNAIAHGDIHLFQAENKIIYANGKGDKRQKYTIDTTEFLVLASIGSHLARAYLTAIAIITVYEFDQDNAKKTLPDHIHQIIASPPFFS